MNQMSRMVVHELPISAKTQRTPFTTDHLSCWNINRLGARIPRSDVAEPFCPCTVRCRFCQQSSGEGGSSCLVSVNVSPRLSTSAVDWLDRDELPFLPEYFGEDDQYVRYL